MYHSTHPWIQPLQAAASIAYNLPPDEPWAFLHSGTQTGSERYSFLAFHPRTIISAEDFASFSRVLTQDKLAWENAWFGYLGYRLKNQLENLSADPPGFIKAPALWMAQFNTVLRFDHKLQTLEYWSTQSKRLPQFLRSRLDYISAPPPPIAHFSSNMSRDEYIRIVEETIAHIHRGDFYQANITRKFYGSFAAPPDGFALFCQLCSLNPAPYSAFIQCGDLQIISSSPERFLAMAANGDVSTRPIKGSMPRSDDAGTDAQLLNTLQMSAKDRAENLMIVDLMRNDFSRGCIPGSIAVRNPFKIESFATIHHMVSEVIGRRKSDITPLKMVQLCFPPGSMTGTPKIRAMEWCSQVENMDRGIYSGALGWFGGDGTCELSVIIRTLILQDKCFEFQVGGGIVADSNPELEWQEILAKAQAISNLLNLSLEI